MFQGKIEASEVVQSLKILGINISEKQAEKILQRSEIYLLKFLKLLCKLLYFCNSEQNKWDCNSESVGTFSGAFIGILAYFFCSWVMVSLVTMRAFDAGRRVPHELPHFHGNVVDRIKCYFMFFKWNIPDA